jgi:hypothetical protein
VIAATPLGTLAAEEPSGNAPPAASIREWKSETGTTPSATPTAGPAHSIREWKTAAGATPTANCPTAPANPAVTPVASAPAKPAVSASAPKSPITISFTSSLREGNLVVMLDDVPVFNEKFQKPMLMISQTTTWDPLQIPTGTHRLSAKVYGSKKTYFSKVYDLQVSHSKGSALRFVMQGDKLTVELAS